MDEAFFASVADKTEYRDANARRVDNGYVLTGQRRWIDPATGACVASVQAEAIATDGDGAASGVNAFLSTGAFVAQQPAA